MLDLERIHFITWRRRRIIPIIKDAREEVIHRGVTNDAIIRQSFGDATKIGITVTIVGHLQLSPVTQLIVEAWIISPYGCNGTIRV